jgi:SAM-dependent methyltransferase
MDAELFSLLGLDAVFTNIDVEYGVAPETNGGRVAVPDSRSWLSADAHCLPFEPDTFDIAFVADGLHHCRAPHLALTEMVRVARRGVIVVESRESWFVRTALRAGLAAEYEINNRLLSTRTRGGADFGPVPNFVFRWTEREFEKTVRCYKPELTFDFHYFYGVSMPTGSGRKANMLRAARVLPARVAPRQGNLFAMCAFRSTLQPFLEVVGGNPRLKPEIRAPDSASVRRERLGSGRRRRENVRVTEYWEGWPDASRRRFEATPCE